MPTQLDLLTEAYSRGILPDDKKAMYEEAARRGLIAAPSSLPSPDAEATAQATGDILHREQGMTLVKSDNGDGTATYTPTQTEAPQQLSNSEQLAIYDAHRMDKNFGEFAGQQPDRGTLEGNANAQSFARVKARRVAGQSGITNFSNSIVNPALQIGPAMAEMTKPMEGDSLAAQGYNALLNQFMPGMDSPEAQAVRDRIHQGRQDMADSYSVDPNSTAGKVGGFIGGAIRYANPAVAAVADAGDYRAQVDAARKQGQDISPEQELLGVGIIAANNLALGKIRPGYAAGASGDMATQQAFKASVGNAVKQYALGMGYSASDMIINGIVTDAVEKATTNPDLQIGGESLNRAAVGAAGHGLVGTMGFVHDVANGLHGEGVEQKLRALQDQKSEADRILQTATDIAPETEAKLKHVSDHNAALMQEVLDRVEKYAGPDSMENMLERISQATDTSNNGPVVGQPVPRTAGGAGSAAVQPDAVGREQAGAVEAEKPSSVEAPAPEVTSKRKFVNPHSDLAVPPAELKDAEGVKKFASENGYDSSRLEGKTWRAMLADMSNQRIEREQGGLPKTTEGGKTILPDLPKEAPDMKFRELKSWAKQNGYERTEGISDRYTLMKEMEKQRRNSKTDLPELPASSKTWNPNQARYWAEQNGYKVEEGMTVAEIKAAVRDQHKATSTSRPDEAKLAALNTTTEQAKIAKASMDEATPKKKWYSGAVEKLKDYTLDVGERIRDLSEPVFGRLMRTLELDPRQRIADAKKDLLPIAEGIQSELGKQGSAKDEQFKALWHAQDWEGMKAMLSEKNAKALEGIRPVLQDLHAREVKAGIRTGSLGENYLPSSVKDLEKLQSLHPDRMSDIEEAWHQKQASQGGKPLTDAEKVDVANNVIAGFSSAPGGNRPGFAKARTRGTLTPEELSAYEHPFTALMHRVERGERSIGKAEFLGKGKSAEPAKLLDSVGALVKREVETGNLDPQKEKALVSLLHSRLAGDMNAPSKEFRLVRQAIHLLALGHITSGVRQLTDLAIFSIPRHGLSNTIGAVGDALRLTSKDKALYLHTLGLDPVTHDFVDPGKIGRAVDVVTKWNGFQKIDVFTKEVEINAFRRKLEGAAKDQGGESFRRIERDWKNVMGEKDFHDAVDAAASGDFTNRNLRDLSAMALSDVQPITMSQMPRKFLESGDGRLFYTLRTFQLKQLANIRRDIVKKLATPGQRAEGVTRLVGLMGYGVMANFGVKAMEDLVNGKDLSNTDIPERAMDAGLNIVGTNRFMATKASQGHPLSALLDVATNVSSFVKPVEAPFQDIETIGDKKGLESLRLVPIPIVNDLLYYWSPWGRGYTKNQEDAKKEYREKLKELRDTASSEAENGNTDSANAMLVLYNDRRRQGPGDGRNHPLSMYDLQHTIDRQLQKARENGTH